MNASSTGAGALASPSFGGGGAGGGGGSTFSSTASAAQTHVFPFSSHATMQMA